MDETQNGQSSMDWGAWTGARLGRAIDVWTDREINKSAVIVDPSQAYGVDEYGNLYQLGQYNQTAQMPANRKVSPTLMLLMIIGAIVLAKG